MHLEFQHCSVHLQMVIGLLILSDGGVSRKVSVKYLLSTLSQKNVTLFIFVISLSNFIRFC